MVSVLPDPSGLSQSLENLGLMLGQGIQRRRAQSANQRQQDLLSQIIGSSDLTSLQGQQDFLSNVVSSGVPLQNALGVLDRAISQQRSEQQAFQVQDPQELSGLFQRLGIESSQANDWAELYGNLSQGGRTSFANMLIDRLQRGEFGSPSVSQMIEQGGSNLPMGLPPEEAFAADEAVTFDFPKVDLFGERTPKERAQLKTQLLKENNNEYRSLSDQVRKNEAEYMRYDQLEKLNNSGKLPEGLQRLNINWNTGELRIPAAANAETQLFVKTINDFTVAAKDSFGGRITNFELGAFLKRLPTLANSEEGRRLILDQMKAIKKLDMLYEDSIKQVYDEYGLQNIDRATAERIAGDLRKEDEAKIKSQFLQASQAQEVYEAKQFAPEGKVPARDPEGRLVYIWRNQIDAAEKRGYTPL